jgi:hypothetical protein
VGADGRGYLIEKESDAYAFDVRGADVFLTLEPGVRIVFQEDMAMTVADGAGIAALGTSTAPVVLTGAQPTRGFWRGFRTFSDTPNQRFDRARQLAEKRWAESGRRQIAPCPVGFDCSTLRAGGRHRRRAGRESGALVGGSRAGTALFQNGSGLRAEG